MNKRVPPYSADAEKGIIGVLLVRPDILDEAISTGLSAADFYVPKWATAYAEICQRSLRGEACHCERRVQAASHRGCDRRHRGGQ